MVDSKQQWKAWLYLSPAIVLLLIFTVWPIINTLRMAFLNDYSIDASHVQYSAEDTVTVYGNIKKDGDMAVFDDSCRFVAGDSIFELSGNSTSTQLKTNSQKSLINKINNLSDGQTLENTTGLVCTITSIYKEYDVNTMKMSFYATAEAGGKEVDILCKSIKKLDFDITKNSKVYLTGEITKTDNLVTPYSLNNATYTIEEKLTKKELSNISSYRLSALAAIDALVVNSSYEAKTYQANVCSIEAIESKDTATLVCEIYNDGKSYYVKCNSLNISEQTGLTMEGFHFGFKNFQQVVNYAQFGTCLKNTLLLCVLTVPLSTLLALVISVCLNSIKVFQKFLQTIYFLPYVTNSIAIGMVFATMFNMVGYRAGSGYAETVGIVNNVIEFFGGTRVNWMNAGSTYGANLAVMVIYIVWNALPFKILILLGGLQSVNKQYYDAAKIDGTSKWRTFWRITVPLLSPMIAYVIITGFIGGFKEYTSIVGVFGETMGPAGDPVAGGSLNTMVGYIYNAIKDHQGKASAASLILFGIILVVTLINLKVSSKKVTY